jgi:hypothetical protein
MTGEFSGHCGVGIMITSDFFIRQLPLSGNLNFPSGSPHPAYSRFALENRSICREKGSLKAYLLKLGKNEGGACSGQLGMGMGKSLAEAGGDQDAGLLASIPAWIIPGLLRKSKQY